MTAETMRLDVGRQSTAAVHLLCGLVGAGKSTHARQLAAELPAVRFGLDEWMLALHGLSYDHPEYPDKAARCKKVIWLTARDVLHLGHDVVLDWNMWSRRLRAEWQQRAESAGYAVVLHHVDVPLATALTQVRDRASAAVSGAHIIDAEGVRHSAAIFEPPDPTEGIDTIVVRPP